MRGKKQREIEENGLKGERRKEVVGQEGERSVFVLLYRRMYMYYCEHMVIPLPPGRCLRSAASLIAMGRWWTT